jgi:AbrB family looped-hinge helix DNA binding protein
MKPATTRLSSKGQVVIPEEIRTRLGLVPGTQFAVIGDGDVVILKALAMPSLDQFDDLIAEVRQQAAEAGLTPADVTRVVAEERAAAAERRRNPEGGDDSNG